MEAMRACTKTSRAVPVEIIKLGALNTEIFRSRRDNSMRGCPVDLVLGIFGSSDNEATNYLSVAVNYVLSQREFDTSQNVISGLKVVELDGSDTLGDRTVSAIFVRDQVMELGDNRRVVRVRIVWISWIVDHWLARVSSWNQIVENS